jgi:hypothetical protein
MKDSIYEAFHSFLFSRRIIIDHNEQCSPESAQSFYSTARTQGFNIINAAEVRLSSAMTDEALLVHPFATICMPATLTLFPSCLIQHR